MDYHGKGSWDVEFMSHKWGSLKSALSIVLSCIYIGTIHHDILLCQSGVVTFGKSTVEKILP